MEDGIGEECGVCGVYMKSFTSVDEGSLLKTPSLAVRMVSALQHRGQRSAGICSYNPLLSEESKRRKIMVVHKDVGLVEEVFKIKNFQEHKNILKRCRGRAVIGHTRYSTSGRDRDNYFAAFDEAQPFERRHQRKWKRFAIAFNGNIVNSPELRNDLERKNYVFETEVDTEVLMALLAREINGKVKGDDLGYKPSLFDVFSNFVKPLDGCYNMVALFGDGDLVALRDPHGFRPFSYGESDEFYGVASESFALKKAGFGNVRDIKPGEMVLINSQGVESKKICSTKRAFCHFEDVYFSKADSVTNGKNVRGIRQNLGRELAKTEPLRGKLDKDFIVVPAPRTAIAAAESFSRELGLELIIAIEKDDSYRGFINGKGERNRIMNSIYTVHGDVRDRKVIVIDDSLVRGETFMILAKLLKEARAKEVHGRFTEPKIINPCFYGIDYPSSDELLAARFSRGDDSAMSCEEKISKYAGVDSVHFQSLDGLVRALGMPKNELCLACLNGEYPTEFGRKRFSGF